MYNEDIKKRFVEESTSSKTSQAAMIRLFNLIAPYEGSWNADICTRGEDDIQGIIDRVSGRTSSSRYAQVSILKKYGKWCLDNGVSGASDGILNISQYIGGMDTVRQQMVATPAQMQSFLNDVFAPEDAKTYDDIYRVYCWLNFMGVPKDKIMQIDSDCIDFERLTLSIDGRSYEIYAFSVPAFKNVTELNYFFVDRNGALIKVSRRSGPNIMRGIRATASEQTIIREISAAESRAALNGKDVKRLSSVRIRQSGLFFRMYQREIRGYCADFTDAATEDLKDKGCENADSESYRKRMIKYVWQYKIEYERWKQAFALI